MKLGYWLYVGPAHIGTLRIASSFENVHAIMHAPLGDDYFNVMRSMLERKRKITPVTASVVDRHVLARGSQEKVIENIERKSKEVHPDLIILTPTCTSSILQEDLQNFVNRAAQQMQTDVLLADVNHYRVNEIQAADNTLEQIIKFYLEKAEKDKSILTKKTDYPSVNILGPSSLSFHLQHDIAELKRLLKDLGISINLIVPEGCSVENLKKLPQAWFNITPYREIGGLAASFLEKTFQMPWIQTSPIGIQQTTQFVREIQAVLAKYNHKVNFEDYINLQTRHVSQMSWFTRSIDAQNLLGKTAIVFGDSTHASALTKILSQEMGIQVLLSGTYCKSDEVWFRNEVKDFCEEVLITEDFHLVAKLIEILQPSAIFGTQMERHVGKRLRIPCGVISAPIHIQNFPLGYRPFLGFEGSNQISDLIYNTCTLGMEDHLISIFGEKDLNKNELEQENMEEIDHSYELESDIQWTEDAINKLNSIPSFVRTKVKKKIEKFAQLKNITKINSKIMDEAKEFNLSVA